LVAMQHADMVEVGDGETRMLEDHEACDGQGCRGCGWIGQVGRWVSDKQLPKPESLNDVLARGAARERKLQDQAGSSRRFGRRHPR
jgi:hypothetical protein